MFSKNTIKNDQNSDLILTGGENQTLTKRFQQILLGTQIIFFGAVLVNYSVASLVPLELTGIRLLGFFLIIIICEILKRLIFKTQLELAGNLYILMMIFFSGFVGWMEGGMDSIAIVALPIFAILTTLFAKTRFAFFILALIFSFFVFFGLNNLYDWYPPPESTLLKDVDRFAGISSILLFAASFGWIFGRDMRKAFSDLHKEHERVVDAQSVIQKIAQTDSLTGLLNRSGGQTVYESMILNLDDDNRCIGFYFIDLDNFKVINDVFDHNTGDQLLKIIGERLTELLGPKDVACRLGGDEFVVFFKGNEYSDFDNYAKKIVKSIARPYSLLGSSSEVTASVGISVVSDPDISFDEIRKQADMAMYKAKLSGKNKYHYYSHELHQEYMRNINIVEGLKDALNLNLLEIHFQPKINLITNKIIGTEALLRWDRGNPDNVMPDEFIPVLESTELIYEIGAWVIQESCKQCKSWHDAGYKISVSCNVSTIQLSRSGFCQMVSDVLENTGLEPQYLEIEMTEHFLLKENRGVKRRIKALKNMGVRVAIDDFGTGYSNMNYLTRLKVDVLKLDHSFVSLIGKSEESMVVVKAIIEMATVLDMTVVAEGVETRDQRDILKELGCNIGQGFLWSQALTALEFPSFIENSVNQGRLKIFDKDDSLDSMVIA